MVDELTIDYDRMRTQINGTMRGDEGIEPPVLVDATDRVTVVDRSWFSDLVTGFGWVKRKGPFPPSYKAISERARNYPGDSFEVYELLTGELLGLSEDWLEKTVRFCAGNGQYDPENFEIYHPSGSTGEDVAPFAVVTSHTPEEFAVHRALETKSNFVDEFGAGACRNCQKKFDFKFVECPDCGRRPDSVQHNIELVQEEHDGVIAMIAPIIEFGPSSRSALAQGDVDVRKPLEFPDPEFSEIKSPGLEEKT